jgi:hypothetical protein
MINDALRGAGQGLGMEWARMLAYVAGTVDQELLAGNEYLAAENRIIKAQLKGRVKLSDAERGALGEIGHRLGRKVLADVATVASRTLSGLVSEACRPQIRWLEGASMPGQTSDQARR